MSREIAKDFESFKKYALNLNSKIEFTVPELSSVHKKYLGLLIILAELRNTDSRIKTTISEKSKRYFFEGNSDIGTAIISCLYGLYKPSKMLLRSSIENLLKAVGYDYDNGIIKQKSVYEIFNIAEKCNFFSTNKDLFRKLKSEYVQLCRVVHTATESEMEGLTYLKIVPQYNKRKFTSQINKIHIVSELFLTIACQYCRDYYLYMHPQNQKEINRILKSSITRKLLLG